MTRISDFRIVARLDIKNEFVIKGIHLEGLRKIGDPYELALKYYNDLADEIIMQDSVASLYGRNNLFGVLKKACREVFIPIVIGGGIRSTADVRQALDSGADRVCINSALFSEPDLIEKITRQYGSQCLVCSIEAKRMKGKSSGWGVYYDCGREDSGWDLVDWVKHVQDLGVGELLLTSIDNEGTKSGLDLKLCEKVRGVTSIPIVLSGGAGRSEDILTLYRSGLADGVALASILHYNIDTITAIKEYIQK